MLENFMMDEGFQMRKFYSNNDILDVFMDKLNSRINFLQLRKTYTLAILGN